jgi:hypothetical protein
MLCLQESVWRQTEDDNSQDEIQLELAIVTNNTLVKYNTANLVFRQKEQWMLILHFLLFLASFIIR